jgi:hypothetical protein
LRNVVTPYFGSKVVVEWLDRVVRIVNAREEPHPVGVPQNLAPNKLQLSPQKHIGVSIPYGTSTLSFLFVRNSKSNSGPEEAIANLQNKIKIIRSKIIQMNRQKLLRNKIRTIIGKIIQIEVQLSQYNTMHKFVQEIIVEILQIPKLNVLTLQATMIT